MCLNSSIADERAHEGTILQRSLIISNPDMPEANCRSYMLFVGDRTAMKRLGTHIPQIEQN